jgi:uncharacterized protein YbaA (DUF1428 family)
MPYLSGFVAAVPTANKQAYIDHAQKSWPLFKAAGALEQWECWGDNVPPGQTTSFPMAVQAKEDETVVLSWILWPDKATAEAVFATMETDPKWEAIADMPLDGRRMIYGDFDPILIEKA